MTAVDLAQTATTASALLLAPVLKLVVPLGSVFSLASLACALAIIAGHVVARRRARGRPVRLALLRRVLFPRSIWLSDSTKADLIFLALNVWVTGQALAFAFWSAAKIGPWVGAQLDQAFGAAPLAQAPTALVMVIGTVAAYLAYELGYWFDHYLSHKVPALWAIHKAHHTAEVLTPLTVFRVHPLETLKFHNILAVTLGVTHGVTLFLFGPGPHVMLVFGQNAIMVVFFLSLQHLQHTHAWMTFGGGLGRLLISPAHHQIHHSDNPDHFGKNFGSFLTVWDRVFGTLHTPERERPRALRFGAPAEAPHSLKGALALPVVEAFAALRPPRGRTQTFSEAG